MRLFATLLVAGTTASGSGHASSIQFLDSNATSPSTVFVGLSEPVVSSFVVLGTMPVDTGKVAAVDARPTNRRMGPELMVIRGGEVGSASPEPSSIAPVQQAAAGGLAPSSEATDGGDIETEATQPEGR